MRLASMLRLRLRSFFSRAHVERELDEELTYHLERQIDEYVAAGMTREDARRAALRSMEGLEQRKEECRDVRGLNLLDHLGKDVRFALRQLRKDPGFAATAVSVLALGICASVAIFAFVDAALLKPLPYRDPARLIAVYESLPQFPLSNLSYPDYLDWKERNRVFSAFDIYHRTRFLLATPSGADPVRGARITSGFFRTLGVAPILGRDLRPGEDQPAAPRVALISYACWRQRYGGAPGVLGQVVTLDDSPTVIVGVLPRDFHFAPAGPAEFWAAIHATRSCDVRRSCHSIYGVARLRNGTSFQAALADVTSIARQLEKQYPDSNRGQGAALQPLTETITGDIRPILMVLAGGAWLLLLIAAVNVAGLVLVRSESRKREIAMRTALGASRGRLLAQFVTEALLLAGAGGALGIAAAAWTIQLLSGLVSEGMLARMPFLQGIGLNLRGLAVAVAIALLAALLLSFPPILRTWSTQLREGLAEASRGSAGTTWRRLGSRLVVLEIAAAMVLLVGAGLLGQSLYRLLHVELGIRPEHLVTLDVGAPQSSYSKDAQAVVLAREVISRVESLPGIRAVGITVNGAPLSGNGNTTWFHILGRPWHGEHNDVAEREVTPDYFSTLGARLARGRYFTESEDAARPGVAIVNRSFADHFFPGEDPVGKQLVYNSTGSPPIEIVGLVENIREGPLETAIPPVLYRPFNQNPDRYFTLVVRTSLAESPLLPLLVATVRQIDSGIATAGGATMRGRIEDSPSAYIHRSLVWLVGGFAGLALLLGVVGLYGVVAYSVSRRNREIGIRMALGAQAPAVYRMILREAALLAAMGVAAGALGSVAAATLFRTLLFGVSSWDLPTLAGVALLLGLCALLAGFLPARRAARVNPADVLRAE